MLTRQHHKVIKQFLHFRDRSAEEIKKANALAAVCPMLELRLAHRSPTLEAEYALDERTPLVLYDSLVP